MGLPLIAVLVSAVSAGLATVLQAMAVRRVPVVLGLRTASVAALLRSPLYLSALALVLGGFALTAAALQTLPVFIVQAARASSLAVTAVASVALLSHRLTRLEIAALVGVCLGLATLALCTPAGRLADASAAVRTGLLASVVLLVVAAAAAMRMPVGRGSGVALALVAGLAFAIPPVAARGIGAWRPLALLSDQAAWALGISALIGLGASALALQRASVVLVTCLMVSLETVLSAGLGVAIYGDEPARGRWGLAALGIAITLGSSLALARFGSPQEQALAQSAGMTTPTAPRPARTAKADQPRS